LGRLNERDRSQVPAFDVPLPYLGRGKNQRADNGERRNQIQRCWKIEMHGYGRI
jgi:hypothetical protein